MMKMKYPAIWVNGLSMSICTMLIIWQYNSNSFFGKASKYIAMFGFAVALFALLMELKRLRKEKEA